MFGGARRDRTADLLHAMQALSQLSYGPESGAVGHWVRPKQAAHSSDGPVPCQLASEPHNPSTHSKIRPVSIWATSGRVVSELMASVRSSSESRTPT